MAPSTLSCGGRRIFIFILVSVCPVRIRVCSIILTIVTGILLWGGASISTISPSSISAPFASPSLPFCPWGAVSLGASSSPEPDMAESPTSPLPSPKTPCLLDWFCLAFCLLFCLLSCVPCRVMLLGKVNGLPAAGCCGCPGDWPRERRPEAPEVPLPVPLLLLLGLAWVGGMSGAVLASSRSRSPWRGGWGVASTLAGSARELGPGVGVAPASARAGAPVPAPAPS